jgi:hypothetical protein
MSAPIEAELSPAQLLARDAFDRVEVVNKLDAYVADAAARAERLALELAAAEREFARARDAYAVAYAVTATAEDRLHGRRPGDVIVELRPSSAREFLVLGVDARDPRAPRYLTIQNDQRNARPGDSAAPEWRPASDFLRP